MGFEPMEIQHQKCRIVDGIQVCGIAARENMQRRLDVQKTATRTANRN